MVQTDNGAFQTYRSILPSDYFLRNSSKVRVTHNRRCILSTTLNLSFSTLLMLRMYDFNNHHLIWPVIYFAIPDQLLKKFNDLNFFFGILCDLKKNSFPGRYTVFGKTSSRVFSWSIWFSQAFFTDISCLIVQEVCLSKCIENVLSCNPFINLMI